MTCKRTGMIKRTRERNTNKRTKNRPPRTRKRVRHYSKKDCTCAQPTLNENMNRPRGVRRTVREKMPMRISEPSSYPHTPAKRFATCCQPLPRPPPTVIHSQGLRYSRKLGRPPPAPHMASSCDSRQAISYSRF